MLKKVCSACKVEKSLDSFHYRNKKKETRKSACKECACEASRKWRSTVDRKYIDYKYEAKRRGLEFELTFKEFASFENVPCHYCGDEMKSIGLDRVDNDLGYFMNNVVSSCHTCNSIKHVYDKEEFLRHVEKIFTYQQKVKNDQQESFS